MPTPSRKSVKRNKHFVLDETKINRAQKILGAHTETETIERALDALIGEHERATAALKAHERLLTGDGAIRDVFGNLEA
jgi:ribosomal 50S subunit-associated protein YjgA (DUF615 family)